MIVEFCLFFIAILIFLVLYNKDGKPYPPGPFEFPYFGSGFVGHVDEAQKMRKKYGDLFSTTFGKIRTIYIMDYKLAKEMFNKMELCGRANWKLFRATEKEITRGSPSGLIMSSGPNWQHNRRFVLRHLRDLGMGKSRMEGIIQREAEHIVEELNETEGKPCTIPFAINVCTLNIVWGLVTGHRYGKSEISTVKRLIKHINDSMDNSILAGLVEFFPIIPKVVPDFILKKYFYTSAWIDGVLAFEKHIMPYIKEHEQKLNPDDPQDLIDDYLIDMKNEKTEQNQEPAFTHEELMRNAFDLFIAGMDTTSNTLSFFFFYMAHYQEEQKKAQKLIDEVVARDSLPGLEHRDQLTYIDALVNEVTRMAPFASFGVNHCALEDTEINGYFIPKDSVLFSVAGATHMDPKYFENPQKFDPTRFLTDEGKFISQMDGFQPFGIGRRQCIGEGLARMDLFLLAAAVLQNFTIEAPEGKTIDLTPKRIPLISRPNIEQKIIFKPRK